MNLVSSEDGVMGTCAYLETLGILFLAVNVWYWIWLITARVYCYCKSNAGDPKI